MAHDVFKFVAVKRIVAEHPIGSGIDVVYEPGDDVPAGEWGRSADNLIEVGKIMRVAVLVSDENDSPEGRAGDTSPPPASEKTADEVNAETADEPPPASSPDATPEWPKDHGKGDYELSDGSHVYGQNKARAAQEALDNQGGDGA